MDSASWGRLALAAALAALACGDPGAGAGDGGPVDTDEIMNTPSTGEPGPCTSATRVGGTRIDVRSDYPSVSAAFADGVVPMQIWFEVEGGGAGDCLLEQHIVPVCDEMCASDETCDYDGECIPYPAKHGVGTITVVGLAKPVVMEPKGEAGATTYSFIDLEHPIAAPGDEIVAQAEGDTGGFGGFTLHGRGVELIDLLDEEPILMRDEDLPIDWTPGQGGASVTLKINIDQHGASPIRLSCETADTGAYVIPAALVNALLDAGVTGYPSLAIGRRTIERMQIDDVPGGCIEFEVASLLTRTILVEGHIPCQGDWECPEGMICDEAIETCVDEP